MTRENTLYHYIYRSIVTSIFIGEYKKGQTLPTVSYYAKLYGVSAETVRNAYYALVKDGFIHMSKGKKAVVVFQPFSSSGRSPYRRYLQSQKEAVRDAYDLFALFFPDLLAMCASMCSGEDMRVLSDIARNVEIHTPPGALLPRFYTFYKKLVALSENDTLMDLFDTLIGYIQVFQAFLSLAHPEWAETPKDLRNRLTMLMDAIEAQDFVAFRNLVRRFISGERLNFEAHIKEIGEIDPELACPFSWPQKKEIAYISVAFLIKIEISRGDYKMGDLLPSEASLMDTYHVSRKTIRNALSLLKEISIIKTIKGKGTVVHSPSKTSPVNPSIRLENLDPKPCLEALLMMASTCTAVITSALPHIKEESLRKTERSIRSYNDETDYLFSPVARLIDLYLEACPCKALRSISDTLVSKALIGCHHRHYFKKKFPNYFSVLEGSILLSLEGAKKGDAFMAADAFEKMISLLFIFCNQLTAEPVRIKYPKRWSTLISDECAKELFAQNGELIKSSF